MCPSCGAEHAAEERLCRDCGMPLVLPEAAEPDGPGQPAAPPAGADAPLLGLRAEARERARKVAPEYTRGPLVRVAGGRNQAEAELIRNMLLEEGVPSLVRRSAAFDVPDFLAAGPRDVLVPESGADAARELLNEAGLAPPGPGAHGAVDDAAAALAWRRRALGLLLAIAGAALLAALVAWALVQP